MQITASHNAAPWNGLKLFGPDGQVLSAETGRKVKELFEAGACRNVPYNELGAVRPYRQAEEVHGDLVLHLVDGPRIRGARFKAFLDGNGGAGGPLGRRLLAALGGRDGRRRLRRRRRVRPRAGADGREPGGRLPARRARPGPPSASPSTPTRTAWRSSTRPAGTSARS